MRGLEKLPSPEVLQENFDRWTEELLERVENNHDSPWDRRRYAHEDIKEQLKNETRRKCAYCESRVLHVDFGHVEHLRPKRRFPGETYIWTNLTLACTKCNNSKSDTYREDCPPLNPYEDTPSELLVAAGPTILAKDRHPRARHSIRLLKLNRGDLLELRSRKIERLQDWIDQYRDMDDGPRRQILADQIRDEISQDEEFTFVARQRLQRELPDLEW